MAKESLTNKSKKHLEKLGLIAEVVERRIPHSFITQDLFGFADLLAFGAGRFVLVQTTSRDHLSHRRKKIHASDTARKWVENGGVILLHGWDKPERLWRLKEEEVLPDHFPCDS